MVASSQPSSGPSTYRGNYTLASLKRGAKWIILLSENGLMIALFSDMRPQGMTIDVVDGREWRRQHLRD